jgi:hypothetical protein
MPMVEPVTAKRIETTPGALVLVLPDHQVVQIAWEKCSAKLSAATESQRMYAELSPGGYGIHWPLLDEDLSINGLLRSQN